MNKNSDDLDISGTTGAEIERVPVDGVGAVIVEFIIDDYVEVML